MFSPVRAPCLPEELRREREGSLICEMKVITAFSTWSQRTQSGAGPGGGGEWPVISYVAVYVLYSRIHAGNIASVYEALALVSNPSLD